MVTASLTTSECLPKSWPKTPEAEEFRFLLRSCRAPKLRSMREFAEQEIILPDGPFEGLRFRCDRQPYSALYFEQVAFAGWRVISASGPSQSGKTLTCTIIPLCYHLFEMRETVVFGLPDKDMANDKWEVSILPVIKKMPKYRDLLPITGEGSRGGKVRDKVIFRNGAVLKFMSAGGDDKERAAFTTRVLIITEVNAFRKTGEASKEGNKYAQLCARIKSFDDRGLIYQECTEEDEESISWQAYTQGTQSRIAGPCPHCGHFVSPDREQLRGWQTAVDELDAQASAEFVCPREECGQPISDKQRRELLSRAKLLHRGQTIDPEGTIHGPPPRTTTLGFRWTGFDNALVSAGTLAVSEFKASRAVNEESAEKELCQFVWARPYKPDVQEAVTLKVNEITVRTLRWPRGIVPRETIRLTVGIDLGLTRGHYTVIAWLPGYGGHIVDYGEFNIAGRDLGPDRAIELALRELYDTTLQHGWALEGTGEVMTADLHLVDIGYHQAAVFRFLRALPNEAREHFYPAKGYGAGKFRAERYSKPKAKSNTVLAIGEGYHLALYAADQIVVFEFDANEWKSFFHARLVTPLLPPDPQGRHVLTPGALSLFATAPREHLTLAKHFTAEKRVLKFVDGEGFVWVWERLQKKNHYLDCGSMSTSAAHWCGMRFTPPPPKIEEAPQPTLTLPDGRPFCVLDR